MDISILKHATGRRSGYRSFLVPGYQLPAVCVARGGAGVGNRRLYLPERLGDASRGIAETYREFWTDHPSVASRASRALFKRDIPLSYITDRYIGSAQ